MKVFITGASGFLGRHVTKALVGAGHAVRALVRNRGYNLGPGVEKVEGDLSDAARLADAIRGTDAVIHLAGQVSRDPADAPSMHAVHVGGTRNLLQGLDAAGVDNIVVSSTSGTIAVGDDDFVRTEVDTPDLALIGRWPYYQSKLYQEREVLRWSIAAEGRRAVLLNPSLLLGPGDERMSSTGDVLRILHGRVPALTSGTMAIVDVRDVAPVFVQALERGEGGERYLLNGANMSVRSFASRVATAGKVSSPQTVLPKRWVKIGTQIVDGLFEAIDRSPPFEMQAVEMACYNWACSSGKAAEVFDFKARDPQETIAQTVEDFRRSGVFRS